MMETSRPVIWLFRGNARDDRYARTFEQAGFKPLLIPVLSTEFLKPAESVPSVEAVVITSARAAEAVADWNTLDDLRSLPWFAVGKATRSTLENLGITCGSPAPGSANALADAIVESGVDRVLFLAGEPHRPELPNRLRRNGVDLEIVTVYRTHARSVDLPDDGGLPDWAVFFSPRGVRIVAEQTALDWDGVAKAAIGPTTAEALTEIGWEPDAIAESPTPESLLRAIRTVRADIL